MKWKNPRVLVSVVLIVVLAYFSTLSIKSVATSDDGMQENFDFLATSDTSNLEMLQSVFDAKNADYATYGYYPQIYSASLQATYYALYVLDAIGKLGDIDQQAVIDYILSFYNSSTNQFDDENSDRYLASKIPGRYYPLSTLLQVNCYAVLSLNILNGISSINIANMLTFIWNCYHPILHGFVGQPYDSSLEDGFKVPTADNTYYAVITLETLGFDWNAPPQDRDDVAAYIEGLQSLSSSTGFYNDKEGIFDSLMEIEPNQFASYYCVKTLDTFGSSYVDIIDKPKFHEHLTALYHSKEGYFDLSDSVWAINYSNIVATAMSLELADQTGFEDFTRSNVLDFLFTNRNYRGGWEASTSVKYHEIIDTFQIVRSLSNTGDISQLSLSDKNEIGSFINLFSQERGYSLLSEDYTSVDMLYNLVSSYDYFGKIGELNIQEIYDLFLGTVVDFSDDYRFFACTGMDLTKVSFRSRPFDYYTTGFHDFVDEINSIRSHENLFKTLDSLKKIFKLNDFASQYDLNSVLQDVIDSQFLDPSYAENFGAFLVSNIMSSPEWKNDLVYLKYSYYAIRTMETISQYLGLGNVTGQFFVDLGFDIPALGTYIVRNIIETATELFFDAKYSDNVELALENLYYTIYMLNTIDQFNLDINKINNFVVSHLNYSNAKNLYYCYKISKYLNLNINFDVEQTHALVQNIFSDTYNEFYLTTERKKLEHDVFLWFCEISKTDQVRLSASYYDVVRLGGTNLFTVDLVNLILSDFGQYSSVKIESPQLGTILLDQLGNNTYQKEVYVSTDSVNYPTIGGELCAYDGAIKKTSVPFSFTTEFDSQFTNTTIKTESRIQVIVNGSHIFVSGSEPIFGGSMYANVYRDGIFVDVIDLLTTHNLYDSTFTFDYSPIYFGNYTFEFYLNDPYLVDPQLICTTTFDYEDPNPDPDPVTEFTYTVIKTESQIQVNINAYYVLVSGNQPILDGSMYADVYYDGNHVGAINLITYHGSNSSIFTFDYSPIDFGNYSFEFYLNDPYLVDPQLLCNATFEYIDPNPEPDPVPEFSYTIIKTESQIQVDIIGYYALVSGNQPIVDGSIYACIYLEGNYINMEFLLTYHGSNSSIFTFDYSPIDFGNYSFDFYFDDPYLATPQIIYNATFEYIDPIPDPDPVTEFTYTVINKESQIQVNITGYYVFVSGNQPIVDGSMYAYIYLESNFLDVIDLLTTHNLNNSTFTFDYSPTYFGNYSFEFYLNDPYFVDPQLICNATFEYIDPIPDPDPIAEFTYTIIKTESQIQVTIIGYYVSIFGNQPIVDGSMYAYIYLESNFVGIIDLLTTHNLYDSTFSFDYSPIYFGNYSFDFYFNDPYLATPQIICNATFDYEDPNGNPDPDPVSEFTYTVIKTESQIQVDISAYYMIVHGNEPIYGGSMYAYIYRDGNFVDVIDLLTTHNLYDSTFTFDYSPTYFGNYSFEFYLNDPYLVDPQLLCNATFEYRNPNNNTTPDPTPDPDDPDPDPNPADNPSDLYEGDIVITLPLALGMVGAATVPLLGTYKTFRAKNYKNKQPSKK